MRRHLSRLWLALLTVLVLGPYVALLTPPAVAGAVIPPSWGYLGNQWAGLSALTGAGSATDDDLLVYDTSATALKRISRAELASVVGGVTAVACTAYSTANVSLSGSVVTKTFASEINDTGTIHDTGSNTGRFVAPSAGYYLFSVSGGSWETSSAPQAVSLRCYKNGSLVTGAVAGQTVASNAFRGTPPQPTWTISLSASDYLECRALNDGNSITWDCTNGVVATFVKVGN